MKQKKYWLRGGIVSVILGLVVLIFCYYTKILTIAIGAMVVCIKAPCPQPLPFIFTLFNVYIYSWQKLLLAATLFFVVLFVVGAIVWWLYGKIKNRAK